MLISHDGIALAHKSRGDSRTFNKMTDHKPSRNLWALSSLASTIGAGDFAVEDHDSFRRQEFVFAALNLLLIGALFALQAISKIVRGRPSQSVIVVLGAGFTIQAVYFIWLRTKNARISQSRRRLLTFWSLGFNSILALVLTSLTIRGDTAYYALMLLPILEAAFRLGLGATLAVIALADFISFLGAYELKYGQY